MERGLYANAQAAIANRDAIGFNATAINRESALALVCDNMAILKAAGIYEACLLHAFTGCRVNHRQWSERVISGMFDYGDRAAFLAAGNPLPGPGPFRIYRGVSGHGRARRLHGLSWTSSLSKACWFSTRFARPNPAVLCADVDANEVIAYWNGRSEQEFIVQPSQWTRLSLAADELQQQAALGQAEMDEVHAASRRSLMDQANRLRQNR